MRAPRCTPRRGAQPGDPGRASSPIPPEAITGVLTDCGQRGDRLEVGPSEHAVTCDVGVDDGGQWQRCQTAWRTPGPECSRRRSRRRSQPFRPARPAPGSSGPDRARPFERTSQGREAPASRRPHDRARTRARPRWSLDRAARRPSWHGTLHSARRSARRPRTFTGRPALAPSRSTRWIRSAPSDSQRNAIAAGSSPKTVS